MTKISLIPDLPAWNEYKHGLNTIYNVGNNLHTPGCPTAFPVIVVSLVDDMVAGTYGQYQKAADHQFITRDMLQTMLTGPLTIYEPPKGDENDG